MVYHCLRVMGVCPPSGFSNFPGLGLRLWLEKKTSDKVIGLGSASVPSPEPLGSAEVLGVHPPPPGWGEWKSKKMQLSSEWAAERKRKI